MKTILTSILLILFSYSLLAQSTLTINIRELRNDKGLVILALKDNNEQIIKSYKNRISEGQCFITIPNLRHAQYSFSYFHDENQDNDLNTYWYGAPREGCGFSNNAFGNFGPPKFEDTLFKFNEDKTMVCEAFYFKK